MHVLIEALCQFVLAALFSSYVIFQYCHFVIFHFLFSLRVWIKSMCQCLFSADVCNMSMGPGLSC